jgi:BASS family bile acid:Na+ symporter
MYLVMPVIAAVLAANFAFHRALDIAIVALAVSPVPPVLPSKEFKAGGSGSYVVGLLVLSALLAIVFVPLALEVLDRLFDRPAHMSMGAVARVVATSVLLPLAAGIIVRRFAPAFAARIARPLSKAGTILLVAAFLPVLVKAWPALIAQIGDFTLLAIVVFVFAGLAVGHLMGGPNPDDRTVLALSTATRHPGVAIAMAQVNSPGDQSIVSAILLTFLVCGIVTVPYVKWRRRRHALGGVR